jgi:DNA-3-methyladenine glycosylase II
MPVTVQYIAMSHAELLQRAIDHIQTYDPILRPVIKRTKLCTIEPHQDYYYALAESIISQQLSVKAAATIQQRFVSLFGEGFPDPAAVLTKTIDELRTAGLSRAKATYIRDLAQHIVDNSVRLHEFEQLSNDEIIRELTAIKGVGIWTAHMFLIFCMGRLDILPTGDLGIKNGMRILYGLATNPTPKQVIEIAETNHWHPYESVASWYIWASLDNKPKM